MTTPHGTITTGRQFANAAGIGENQPRVSTFTPIGGGPSIVRGFANAGLEAQWIAANAFLTNEITSSR